MRTFTFYQKNSSCILTMSRVNFKEAEEELEYWVKDAAGWRCDDEDGEPED